MHTQMKACASEATLKNDADILVKGKLALDQTVLPPLLRIFAATCLPALKEALSEVARQVEGAVVVASEEGSVKTAERMVEAMKSEIAKKHQAEEGAGWQPVSALVRDALRATVVCPGAQAMCDVKAAFDASPLFALKKLKNKICRRQVPFNLHAVYEFKPSNNDVSILVEIQIHDSEVRKASAAQQRFYQIFRAISSEKLHKVEAHHTMTHSKLMKQRSQPAWKSTRDIREPPRHREPTRLLGQRGVDGLETPRHRADAATAPKSRRWRGVPEI